MRALTWIPAILMALLWLIFVAPFRRDTRSWVVIDPMNKPVFGSEKPSRAEAIAAAERYVGQSWRWMLERDFRLSRS